MKRAAFGLLFSIYREIIAADLQKKIKCDIIIRYVLKHDRKAEDYG
jgi:hypothetical protein